MFNLYRWDLRRPFQACRSYDLESPCPGAERRGCQSMTTFRLRPAIALLAAVSAHSALAQTKPSPWFPIPPDAVFETGDTWNDGGQALSSLRRAIVFAWHFIHQRQGREARLRRGQPGDAGQSRAGSTAHMLRGGQYRLRPNRPRLLLRHHGARQKQGFAFGSRNGARFHWLCVRLGHTRRPPGLLALSRRGRSGEEHESRASGLIPTCPTRTPSFWRTTNLQGPERPPLPPHHPRAPRNPDRSTASFYVGFGGHPALFDLARRLAYRQNVTTIAVAPPATAIHETTIMM